MLALSILAETTSGFFDGQTRSIYTPVGQWSPANAQTLWLIIKRDTVAERTLRGQPARDAKEFCGGLVPRVTRPFPLMVPT